MGGRSALAFVGTLIEQLKTFDHIIVDIGGLPRSVFYPLIAFLCKRADQGVLANIHVAVLDDAEVCLLYTSGLPLILHHNTPNNSLYFLWARKWGDPLFVRYERHGREVRP